MKKKNEKKRETTLGQIQYLHDENICCGGIWNDMVTESMEILISFDLVENPGSKHTENRLSSIESIVFLVAAIETDTDTN